MLLEGLQFGRYRFERLLDSGGMSEIYLAEDMRLRRQVAIKTIRAEMFSYADTQAFNEAVELFQREARAIILLDHPYILPLFDYGEENINNFMYTYIVMPYRREGSLADWVRRHSRTGILPLSMVMHFLRQAASALQHAHDHQIIHRDVKPSNFLIVSSKKRPGYPDIQLADFGVAKFMDALSTPSHSVRGTPTYMAPEQWRGEAVPATDQYALAVMIYELLAGRPPFEGGNQQEILYKHTYDEPQPPSIYNPQVPEKIDRVLLQGLRKEPEDRFSTVSEFVRAFQQALVRDGSIRIILTITHSEARNGTRRLITLPDGKRISVNVPAGAYDGQVLRLIAMGERTHNGGQGDLFITIVVSQTEEVVTQSDSKLLERTVHVNYSAEVRHDKPHRPLRGTTFLLVGLAIALVLSGFGLLFYSAFANQIPTDTGLAQATTPHLAKTANRHITPTLPVNLTATAAGHATATVEAAQATGTSEAAVQATATAEAAARATATAEAVQATVTAYSTAIAGNLVLNDSLHDNNRGFSWDMTGDPGNDGCMFISGMYHSIMLQGGFYSPCFAHATNFSNFSYQIKMTIVNGDQGGICFRADSNNGNFYYFHINTNGSFALQIYNSFIPTKTLAEGASAAIKTGPGQVNMLAAVAIGNTFDLFVNMQLVASNITDSTYTNGQIGVVAEDVSNPTDIAFSNAMIRTK